MNQKQFKTAVNGLIRSATTQRAKVQQLIEEGCAHYKDNGDTFYLSYLLNAAIGVRSLPTQTIKGYIKELTADQLIWSKAKDGNMVFKKAVKGTVPALKEVTEPWYEWKGANHQAKADTDIIAQGKAFLKRIEKAIAEGKLKQDTAKAQAFKEALAADLATLEA